MSCICFLLHEDYGKPIHTVRICICLLYYYYCYYLKKENTLNFTLKYFRVTMTFLQIVAVSAILLSPLRSRTDSVGHQHAVSTRRSGTCPHSSSTGWICKHLYILRVQFVSTSFTKFRLNSDETPWWWCGCMHTYLLRRTPGPSHKLASLYIWSWQTRTTQSRHKTVF